MLRIYKHYAFNLQDSSAGNFAVTNVCTHLHVVCIHLATKVMSFSSYPAYLSSLDDFYLMDRYDTLVVLLCVHCTYTLCSGLVMLQTTNGVFNHSIYSLVTHDALLAWQRVRIANWLAKNGKEWSYYVSQYNSGITNPL